jgi:hypothetical protein
MGFGYLSNCNDPIQTDRSFSKLRFDDSLQFEPVSSACRSSDKGMDSTEYDFEGLAIQSDFGDVSIDADICDITEHFPSSSCLTCDDPTDRIIFRELLIEKRYNSRATLVVVKEGVSETLSCRVMDKSPNAMFLFEVPDLPDPADCCNEHSQEETQPDFEELN